MIYSEVLHDEHLIAKLLVTIAAYLILLSITVNNSIYTNAKEIAMNITNTNTHTSSATMAELFFDEKNTELQNWKTSVEKRYPNSTVLTIKDSIKHIKMTKYINSRPVRINVVEMNLKLNNKISIKPIMASNVLNKRVSIKTMAEKGNAIAAINGSYFKPQTGVPLGTMMVNGKLLTGPIYNRVALGIKGNEFMLDRVELNAKIITKNNELLVDNINQPRMLSTYVIVYNEQWGAISPATPKYGMQIAIKNGKITNYSEHPLAIPKNGYVISGPKTKLEAILKEKNIELKTLINNPKWHNVEHIISGGPYLVKENQIFVDVKEEKLTSITGRNPRTAVGYTNDGKFIMVTVDGREEKSIGMTLTELAYFMKSIGCHNAMNLDGGGSSVMYFNGQTVNNPAIKGGIPLSNALVVYEEEFPEEFAKENSANYL